MDYGNFEDCSSGSTTSGSMSYQTPLSEGTHTFSVKASDQAGNTTTSPTSYTWTVQSKFTITATAGANGTISPSGAVTVDYGSSQTFTLTPNTGYRLLAIIVDGIAVGITQNDFTFTNITANHTISATFAIETHTLTVTKTGPGSGNVSSDPTGLSCTGSVCTGVYEYNMTVTLTAQAAFGYLFGGWSGACTGTESCLVTMAADRRVEAAFTSSTYTITAVPGPNGSISPSGNVAVGYGTSQTFDIIPDSGYRLDDVLVDGSSVGAVNNYTITDVTANHTIHASFALEAIAPLDNWHWRNPLPQGNRLNKLAYDGNNTFVAVGAAGTVLTSADGNNWTRRKSGTAYNLNGVTYGNAFAAVGDSGTILTSPDGETWTSRYSGTLENLFGVAYGNDTYVAVGLAGTLLTSSDGVSWSPGNAETPVTDWYGIAYVNNTFIVVGLSYLLNSTNGKNWTASDLGSDSLLYGVAYGNNTFVVVGDGGTILTSEDGTGLDRPKLTGAMARLHGPVIFGGYLHE